MDIKIEYTDKEITSFGGVSLLKKMLEAINFNELLKSLGLPKQGSNRGYSPETIITNFITGIWCGASRISDLEILKGDKVIKEILGVEEMCGQKVYSRYFNKFNIGTNTEVYCYLKK